MTHLLRMVLFYWLLSGPNGWAQGVIRYITPSKSLPSQEVNLLFFGMGTDFIPGQVLIQPGDGTRVLELLVVNSRILKVRLWVEPSATPGYRDFRIVACGQQLDAMQLFEVVPPNMNFTQLTLHDCAQITVADFAQAPTSREIFQVRLQGFANHNALEVHCTLENANRKQIFKGQKTLETKNSLEFSNVQLDKITLQKDAFSGVAGALPSGCYHLALEILDATKQRFFHETHSIFFFDGCTSIPFATPGSPVTAGGAPLPYYDAHITFEWTDSAQLYNWALYAVLPQHNSAQDILSSFPIWQEKNLQSGTYTYSAAAPKLEYGGVYAWQVRGTAGPAAAAITLTSPLFWFEYRLENPNDKVLKKLEVTPQQLDLPTGGAYQFEVVAVDQGGNKIAIRPEWKVVPPELGTVDSFGKFTAAKFASHGAVVATYGNKQDLSLVTIAPYEEREFSLEIIAEIFGSKRNYKLKRHQP